MQPQYLFILSPPYSGSTALWQLLQTSSQVSALPDEGQKLPELRQMMRTNPWDPNTQFDWELISRTWHQYWDRGKPILIEKSPPHLCRVDALSRHFQPAKFILLMRDPLAICEALHRRNNMDWEIAANRWLEWLDLHLNTRAKQVDSHVLYYEDMVSDSQAAFDSLKNWMPELHDVSVDSAIEAHSIEGVKRRPLRNLNPQKIQQISKRNQGRVLAQLEKALPVLQQTPYGARYFP